MVQHFSGDHVGRAFVQNVKEDPNAVFAVYKDTHISRSDVYASAVKYRGWLSEQSLQPCDRVGIVFGDQLRAIELMLAAWSLGLSPVFLDVRQSLSEVIELSELLNLQVLYTDVTKFCSVGICNQVPAWDAMDQFLVGALDFQNECEAGSLFFLSSGTTGTPTRHLSTHEQIARTVKSQITRFGFSRNQNILITGSVAFNAVLFAWLRAIFLGSTIYLLPLFFKIEELDFILSQGKVNRAALPPLLLDKLVKLRAEPKYKCEDVAYPNLSELALVGGPVNPLNLIFAYENLSRNVVNRYSTSQNGGISELRGIDILQAPNSVGKPLDGITVKIIDDDGNPVSVGEIGQILVGDARRDDLDIPSGDLGHIDGEGFLYVDGRSEGLVSRNGIKILLADVETELLKLDVLDDCAVIKVSSEESLDDTIVAFIQTEGSWHQVRENIRKGISPLKRPDYFCILTELPRNPSYKVSRKELIARFEKRDTLSGESYEFLTI